MSSSLFRFSRQSVTCISLLIITSKIKIRTSRASKRAKIIERKKSLFLRVMIENFSSTNVRFCIHDRKHIFDISVQLFDLQQVKRFLKTVISRVISPSHRPLPDKHTTDKHPFPRRDSNPKFQQASGCRHTATGIGRTFKILSRNSHHFDVIFDPIHIFYLLVHVLCYGVDGRGVEFRTHPDRLWGPPSLLHNGYRVSFPGVKRPGRGVQHRPPSSAEVNERVEQCLYSPSGSLLPVLG
jgi:hypothetical protein